MLLVLLVVFGAALAVELLRDYFFRKQVRNRITELEEYRELVNRIEKLPPPEKKHSRLVIETDGYVGTLAIRHRSSGRFTGRNFIEHYYIFVLDRESRSVSLVTPLN